MKSVGITGIACSVVVLAFMVLSTELATGVEQYSHKPEIAGTVKSENPLVEEMQILDGVFREVVSAVAVAEGERVHRALAAMHGTMERTHEGVEKGIVGIPRNASRIGEFVNMDRMFHEDLERLAHASHNNDVTGMVALTKKLLDGCVNCHQQFR